MAVCREIHAGYVKCDIDGDGYNTINVCGCDYEDNRYNYTRISKCYGEVRVKGVSAEEVLDLLKQDRFMIATIDAHRSYNRLVKDLGLAIRPPKEKPKPKRVAEVNFNVSNADLESATRAFTGIGNVATNTTVNMWSFLSDWERFAFVDRQMTAARFLQGGRSV